MRHSHLLILTLALLMPVSSLSAATQGGTIPVPLPLFPPSNWWNADIASAPVDSRSSGFITFINNGGIRRLHPDFGGDVSAGSIQNYGFPYIIVDGTQPKKAVTFVYSNESDGVNHTTNQPFPFYPIPDEAISQAHWIEGGEPGNQDLRSAADRHMLIVDSTNNTLYELYNLWFNGTAWVAGSGAFFDMKTNNRRPDTWTSADAAGLAILPGLIRYDEVSGASEIGHAFRVTVRATNGYVFPASHTAGTTTGALPMGARLRLKANKDLSTFPASLQKIFRAFKKYGLIVADNGSDLFISGSYDNRWDNSVLNPAFSALSASDFEVVQLGWVPAALPVNGDANGNGLVGVEDIFYLINNLFAGGPAPLAPADANGNGNVGVDDIFYLINYLFAAGPAPLSGATASINGILGSSSFAPNPFNASAGLTVTWKNSDATTHALRADDASFDTGPISAGASSTAIVAPAAGSHPYHCTIHPSMTGTLVVK